MKLKVTSDGMPNNTRVFNAETGEELENVMSVAWSVDKDNIAMLTVTLLWANVEVDCEPNLRSVGVKRN